MENLEVIANPENKKKLKQILPDEDDLAVLSHYHLTKESSYGAAMTILPKYCDLLGIPTLETLYTNTQTAMFGTTTVPFPPPENAKFTFMDLFAGIGGFRMALQSLGGKCLFS